MKKSSMLCIFIVGCVLCSSSIASTYFSPPLNDTSVISFDTLRMSQKGDNSAFRCSRVGSLLHKDSAFWLIDGAIPAPGEVFCMQGTYPNKVPSAYSNGTILYLCQSAVSSKYSQGIHTLSLTAYFDDTTVSATWRFTYAATEYRQFHASLLVDSVWHTYSLLVGNEHLVRFKLVYAEPFDSSIYGNADHQSGNCIKTDISNIQKDFIYKNYHNHPFVPNDTLGVSIFQISRDVSQNSEWLICFSFDSLMKPLNHSVLSQPFPIQRALRHFNDYCTSHNLTKGYTPPIGDMRLGPVFDIDKMGDPGWFLNACYDDSFWYIVHGVGSGDCPCGCTHWDRTNYKISDTGIVSNFTTMVPFSSITVPVVPSFAQYTSYYSLMGRLLPRVGAPTNPSGVYLRITSKNGIRKKVLKLNDNSR